MEIKSTGDFRELIKSEIYKQGTNASKVSKLASISQPAFKEFLNGKKGINSDTVLAALPTLGIRLTSTVSDNLKQPEVYLSKEIIDCFRQFIEDYKLNTDDDKPAFTVDYIIELLEKSFKQVTI